MFRIHVLAVFSIVQCQIYAPSPLSPVIFAASPSCASALPVAMPQIVTSIPAGPPCTAPMPFTVPVLPQIVANNPISCLDLSVTKYGTIAEGFPLANPPLPVASPFLPAASPVSALAPFSPLLPSTCPCQSACKYLKKIPIPPPCI